MFQTRILSCWGANAHSPRECAFGNAHSPRKKERKEHHVDHGHDSTQAIESVCRLSRHVPTSGSAESPESAHDHV